MIKHDKLEYYYSVSAPSNGGTTNLIFSTPSQGDFKNYYLNQDIEKGPLTHISVYENGLVVFLKQSANEIEVFTNAEFNLQDDGTFLLDESTIK